MIDGDRGLSIAKQARALGISRGSVYYVPRPVSPADLAVMGRIDELHLEFPSVTPAISVLSALEGLNLVTPAFQPYVLPTAVVILIGLFAIQPLGTERIGKAFGPVMGIWFLALAVFGLTGIWHNPSVFAAVNPLYGLRFIASGGFTAFLVLGGVFLCVTGAEALYADMGHFGPTPIRLSWLGIVFPSLILNYAGQAAIVLDGAPTDGNIFFRLCPGWFLIPMVLLASAGHHHRQPVDHHGRLLDDAITLLRQGSHDAQSFSAVRKSASISSRGG